MSRISLMAMILIASIALLAAPASAQLLNPSFDANAIGTPQDYVFNANGGGSFISSFDLSMPTNGTRFAVMTGGNNGPATPHSNPGGVGTDASGAVTLSQTFFFASPTDTNIEFDCILLGNDMGNADFLEVSISAGGQSLNLVHLDTIADVGPGGASTVTGLMTSPLTHVSVDVGAAFVGANIATPFTLTIHLGNSGDNLIAPRGHIDNFTFSPGTPFATNSVGFIPMGGFVRLSIRTALPFTEYYTLVSHDTAGPKGMGAFGGLYLDNQTIGILTLPVGTPGLHDITNAAGEFDANVFLGIAPIGFVFDYMLAAFLPGGIEITPVKRGAWGQQEDF